MSAKNLEVVHEENHLRERKSICQLSYRKVGRSGGGRIKVSV